MEKRSLQELLFADVALQKGAASARDVAAALQRHWENHDTTVAEELERTGALDQGQRTSLESEVERLVRAAEGDPGTALARRGGIDQSIHASLKPRTSRALLKGGAGARAPLRTLLDGRYEDFSLVGKGGMGVVYLALDTELNRRVAFKMVRPDPSAPKDTPAPTTPLKVTPPTQQEEESFEELRIRFLQEAWVTGAMEHPGVVPVYELGQTAAGIPYYTMRYVKGERTLAIALKGAATLDQRLALLEPFLKVCDAVRYAHARGVVHRDLKPENIALGEFGEVVVLDWGLSKMEGRPDVSGSLWRSRITEYRDATDLATVAGALGTPGYMAPEAALGKSEDVGPRSDVYSLGAILFEILTGRMPFVFKTFMDYVQVILEQPAPVAQEVEPALPAELSEICARALARQKEDRFASVDDLARAVRRWQTEGPIQRQIEQLVRNARSEIAAAREATGNMVLWHLDRASTACTRVLHVRPDDEVVKALSLEIKQLREHGIGERVRHGRRRFVVAAGFAVLAIASLVALYVASILDDERANAEERVRTERLNVAAMETEARRAREGEAAARRDLANAHAGVAESMRREGRIAAARLAAAQAVRTAPTPAAWQALVEAEARWTPTLRLVLPKMSATAVAFGGGHLYLAGTDNIVHVVDVESGKTVRRLTGHKTQVTVIAVAPDRARVYTGAANGRVKIWDAKSGKLLRDLPEKLAPAQGSAGPNVIGVLIDAEEIFDGTAVTAIAAGRGITLYVAYSDSTLRYWDLDKGKLSYTSMWLEDVPITTLTIGPRGKHLYYAKRTGEATQWLIRERRVRTQRDTAAELAQIVGTEEGDSVYAATFDNRVLIVELESSKVLTALEGSAAPATSVLLTPDRKRLVAGDAEGTLRVWDVETGELAARLDGFGKSIAALALSPDGALLAIAGADGSVRVWDLRGRWSSNGAEPATATAQTRDRTRTFVARPDHTIEVWDAADGRSLARLLGHTATITALTLDDDETLLFSAAFDGSLRVWDRAEAKQKTKLHTPNVFVTALAVSGDRLYAGTVDGRVEVWDWRRMGKLTRLGDVGAPLRALRLDAGVLHGLDVTGAVRSWDLQAQEAVASPADVTFPEAVPGAKPAPVYGTRDPWVARDPLRRLIEIENRFGVMLEGMNARAVPLAQYDPHRLRIHAWSK